MTIFSLILMFIGLILFYPEFGNNEKWIGWSFLLVGFLIFLYKEVIQI